MMKRKAFKRALCASLAAVLAAGGSIGASAAALDSEPVAEDSAAASSDGLPAFYSSRDLGYVTTVKSQFANSCWAFAAMATLESFLLRHGEAVGDMSTTQLNMWATDRSNGKGWIRNIASYGYPSIAPGYLTSWQGGVLQADLENDTLDYDTPGDAVPIDLARYGVTAVRYLTKSNPADIKRAIIDNGGVYTSYAMAVDYLSDDGLSYYMPPGTVGGAGHSIEVVGWDDDYPRESFNAVDGVLPDADGAWLIKNSHGENNTLGGYFWMSYEDANVFGTRFNPSYSLESYERLDGSVKLIQNEIYGATYEFDYVEQDSVTYMNRLHFDADFNVIDKVMFKTDAVGAAYSIYYVPDSDSETPDADTTHWTRLGEGTVDYQGYICADIDDFAYPENTGTIAVTIDAASTDRYSTIGVGEWLTSQGNYVFLNESERGQSYIMTDGSVQDLMDWYLENNNDSLGGTFVIKAVTKQHYPVSLLGDVDLDGKVNINDVTELQRHLAEYLTLTKTALANADFNRDGKVTIDDATSLQRMLAELPY